jgi:hypothetical protein
MDGDRSFRARGQRQQPSVSMLPHSIAFVLLLLVFKIICRAAVRVRFSKLKRFKKTTTGTSSRRGRWEEARVPTCIESSSHPHACAHVGSRVSSGSWHWAGTEAHEQDDQNVSY